MFRKRNKLLLLLLVSLLFSAASWAKTVPYKPKRVGFDVDDTLLFSTPAFKKGFRSGKIPFSRAFWGVVNKSDSGNSIVKQKTKQILLHHKALGDTIYAITARNPYNGRYLKKFLNEKFGILRSHIFFEPHGKIKKMRELKLDIFYGDSDSDITDADSAGVTPIRIMRSKKSSYKKKYHPGKFGEKVIKNSDK